MKLQLTFAIALIFISCSPGEKPKSQESKPQPAIKPNAGQTSTPPSVTPPASAAPNSTEKPLPSSTPKLTPSPKPSGNGNSSPLPSSAPLPSSKPNLQPPQGGKCKSHEVALSVLKNGKSETLCWDGKSNISDDNLTVKSN